MRKRNLEIMNLCRKMEGKVMSKRTNFNLKMDEE